MNIIRLKALASKEIVRFLKVWTQTLLSPVMIAVLYFVVFGGALSSQITDINGVSYLAFILPGLMIMQSTGNAYQNPSSSLIIAKYHGNIKDLLVAPFTGIEKTLGYLLGAVTRGFITALIIFIMGIVFIPDLSIYSLVWLFTVLLLSISIFSILGTLTGLWAKSFDHTQGIANFILMPMTFLGGVFYSIEMLPRFAQILSYANPVLYMVDASRYAFFGHSSINIWLSFSVLMTFTIVLFGLNWWAFEKNWGLQE